jgi:peptidoglycan-associated lipoprotein
MHKLGLGKVLTGALAGLILAGCQSSGTQEGTTEPLPEDTAPAVTQPVEPEPVRRDVDQNGNPLDLSTGQPLVRVFYFEFDQAVLKPQALASLELHAAFLRNNPDRQITVEGNCDERGTREYNLALGERRADSVRVFLVSSGVRRAQIDTVSYGEERPVDPAHTEAAWAKNRRAEIVYR